MAPIEDNAVIQEGADEEPEDTPAIKELKAIDLKYCEIEKQFEREVEALQAAFFNEKQAPLLEERARVLADLTLPGAEAEKEYGTPACVSFWLQAFQNCEFAEMIEEYDAPVLTYLRDIKKSYVDDKHPHQGFKLEFLFVENPFFFNSSLWVEFYTNYDPDTYQPWKPPDCTGMKCSDIGWKPSKNVTVELVAKQVKGGGAKKAKQKAKSAKEEPRDSFFRFLFRNLKVGDDVPADLSMDGAGPDSMDEDDKKGVILMALNEQFFRLGQMIGEEIIPYAVRYYTGEAGDPDGPEDDSDDDDEDDDGEDDDDEDAPNEGYWDEDEDEDEPPSPPTKGKKKAQKKAGAAPAGKAGEKQEECKQQ